MKIRLLVEPQQGGTCDDILTLAQHAEALDSTPSFGPTISCGWAPPHPGSPGRRMRGRRSPGLRV